MSATPGDAGGPGLLVDLGPAQRPGDPGAALVEECAAALLRLGGGAVRALLLDPGAPLPGTLHSRVLGSALLRWNTASEVRRALTAGPAVYVTFAGAAVPAHVERLGVPVLAVGLGSGADGAAVAGRVVAMAARSREAPPSPSRMRLALVAAPSEPSNARLRDALAERVDVDGFAGDELAGTALAASYDAVVHAAGGTAVDLPVLRSARRVPGVLWLHDVALGDAHRAEAAQAGNAAAALASTLRRLYGERAPAPVLDALDRGDIDGFDAAAERRYGLLLTVDVVRAARAVVVPSDEAARRLRRDQGANGPCPPVSVCDVSDAGRAASHLLELVGRALAVRAA